MMHQSVCKQLQCQGSNGYIALVSILIICAIILLIAISTNLLAISESDMGLQKDQASQTYYLASLCAEDALMKLKNHLNYSGDEAIIINNGSCYIYPTEGSGNQDRIIKTTGTIYGHTRKIKIEIDRVNPDVQINSWQEVADF